MKKEKNKRKRTSSACNIITDFDQIREILDNIDQKDLLDRLSDKKRYMLIDKRITFADVVTSGKGSYGVKDKTKSNFTEKAIENRVEKNKLFYNTNSEIIQYEKKNAKNMVFFCETHQSCIHIPKKMYEFMGLHGEASSNKGFSLNTGKYKTFLVNSCIDSYFDKATTEELLRRYDRLNSKNGHWKIEDISLNEGYFTQIDLHLGVHGLGLVKLDKEFSNLRQAIFAKDKMYVLVEKDESDNCNLYLMFFRNPKFFIIMKRPLPIYIYANDESEEKEDVRESRKGQAKWRDTLAGLAIAANPEDSGLIECPFTNITVDYDNEGTLLRASHILAYAKCKNSDGSINAEKAYDPDNGFLVTANVDALFDKYLITVNPESNEVIKSKMVSSQLIKDLNIVKKIDSSFLSVKKKEYLKYHYDTFKEKEAKR